MSRYEDIAGSGRVRVTTRADVNRAIETREKSRALMLTQQNWPFGAFSYQGSMYPVLNQTYPQGGREGMAEDFCGYVQAAYKANGIVFACILARLQLFTEARFQWRRFNNGRPGDLFGSPELALLETPWPGGTTGDLLARAEQDVSLAGNFFAARRPNRIKRMRPDWVDIVLGSQDPDVVAGDVDAEVLGYIYWPGGRNSGREPQPFLRDEVAHYAPVPDPEAHFRGMSWLTPIVREIIADGSMTDHKQQFFTNGATPNIVVKMDPQVRNDAFDAWVRKFKASHEGVENAYKTLFLGGGADATVVGSTFEQIDFKVVQGAGETRIAAAAGVPPIVVGLSEGLASATYSNYGQARRRFADMTMRPLWRNFAGSIQTIIPPPPSDSASPAQLWYDDRDISALQEDAQDEATILQTDAATAASLIAAGFTPDSVVSAIGARDLSRLVHTGLVSVQLNAPGAQDAAQNGSSAPPATVP